MRVTSTRWGLGARLALHTLNAWEIPRCLERAECADPWNGKGNSLKRGPVKAFSHKPEEPDLNPTPQAISQIPVQADPLRFEQDELSHTARIGLEKIAHRSARIGVIGLGYVGMPLVRACHMAGFSTIGFDTDSRKVERLLRCENYIKHLDASWLRPAIESQQFQPTADLDLLGAADCILICVPTPLTASRDPDLSYVVSTGEAIAATLRAGQLVVLESTTYPGTTRNVLAPILANRDLLLGRDYFLAYSPEREDPGNPKYSAHSIPKVVGGADSASLALADALYKTIVVSTVPVSCLEVAEAAKILENTYRGVNIAMINELKMLFTRLNIDIWEVIEAAKTKPFGFQAFYPGPGLGGHCIPIDPFYLSWLARCHESQTRFIELAGEINTQMPEYVMERLTQALNDRCKPVKGSKICVLGVAYKRDVDDPRESPSFRLIELLLQRGAVVTYSDPYIERLPSMRSFNVPDMESQVLTETFMQSQDGVLIATDHTLFDYPWIVQHAPLVVDTRNATKDVVKGREKIVKA